MWSVEQRTRGNDLAERLLEFGAQVLRLCNGVKKDVAGRHVARELILNDPRSQADRDWTS
jgi:hypothetical protein